MKRLLRSLTVALAIGACLWPCATEADSVTITIQSEIEFYVANGTVTNTGDPNPFTVSFSNCIVPAGKHLHIGVKANTSDFASPNGGTLIPANKVTWTTSNAINGTGHNGTLGTGFAPVFDSVNNPPPGSVDITWKLGALPNGVVSGQHTLVLTWQLQKG